MPRQRRANPEDEPRPTCHGCGYPIFGGQAVIYRGLLINRGMGVTYCCVDHLLDDVDKVEGRPPKTVRRWLR